MDDHLVIETNNLTRRFGDIVAVDSLALAVRAGEVFGFLGHNGAGKTTTVRLLNGVLTPNGGTARVLGLDPVTDGPALRRRTGVLTETPSLDGRLTARENLTVYADLYSVPPDRVTRRVDELLTFFELIDRAEERVEGYSKGMRQRLALCRAMLHNPEVLFLDEPTSGLDPVSTHRVHEVVSHVSQEEGRTVFLCTHNLTEAQKLCDRVAVMEHGRVVAIGTPADLARQVGKNTQLNIGVDPESATQALDILNRIEPGAEARQTDGDTLTISGVDREAIPELVAALAAAGVRIYRVAPQEPSLEDVYFALHGEEELS
jgi:ABC-2 type transport system ATP-binding protein